MNRKTIALHPEGAATQAGEPACASRREFLLHGGLAVSVILLSGGTSVATAASLKGQKDGQIFALKSSYPRQKIGTLSALKTNQPIEFNYPYPNVANMLVKLGTPAGGGVGAGHDVVAFNQQCPHMGGPLQGTYKAAHQVLGPCPLHLTTFDLTRHGLVACGQATESLPQIVLETEGDVIYAVGVQGLLYGYSANLSNRDFV